jgi:hypothetical protein
MGVVASIYYLCDSEGCVKIKSPTAATVKPFGTVASSGEVAFAIRLLINASSAIVRFIEIPYLQVNLMQSGLAASMQT